MHDFIPIFLRTPPQHRWNKPIDLFGPVAFSQQSLQFRASHSFYQEETQEHLLHNVNISRILLTKFTTFLKTPCAPSLSADVIDLEINNNKTIRKD